LAPTDPDVMTVVASVLTGFGRWQQVVDLDRAAMRLDPFINPGSIGVVMAGALYQLGRHPEAAEAAPYFVPRAPTNVLCRSRLAMALGRTGPEAEARAAAAALEKASPGYSITEFKRQQGINYRDPAWVEHYADGLRKAGVPE